MTIWGLITVSLAALLIPPIFMASSEAVGTVFIERLPALCSAIDYIPAHAPEVPKR